MRAKNVFFLLLFVFVLFQGCLPSLHPIYTEDKLVIKEELVGTWIDDQNDDTSNVSFDKDGMPVAVDSSKDIPGVWIFERHNEHYHLIYIDEDGVPGLFDVHLIKLGEYYYIDFYPGEATGEDSKKLEEKYPSNLNQFLAFHRFPVHTFAKVTFEKDQISIALLDYQFIEKLLKEKRIRIKHEKTSENGFILTAQPKEIQQFVEKYADEEKAFSDPIILSKPS